jgi:haloalkane dehalogenase
MSTERRHAAGLAYRVAVPPGWQQGGPTALLVHGWPESSYMWRDVLPALAGAGWRAIAPDLPGYGDSPPDPPGSWERHIAALERFKTELGLDGVALVVHDWGVMIGLRWACDHPDAVRALIISDGGFFSDRRWHDLANVLRTPGDGEAFIESFDRPAFDGALRAACASMSDEALDEYWKAFTTPESRHGALELYRSGDFDKLKPYDGRLAQLGVPALIVWGEQDRFAGVAMAHRFHEELPGSRLEILPGAGHFVWEDEPQATAALAAEFLRQQA